MSGNALTDTKPILKSDYKQLLTTLIAALPREIHIYPFGSAGKKQLSGDIDVFIDSLALTSFYNAPLKDSKKYLRNHLSNLGYTTSQSGIAIHVGIPYNNGVAQIDLMAVENPKIIQHLHNHDYTNDSISGKMIVSLWCDLANLTSPNLKISPYKGLVNRKTNKLITNNKDIIAKIILGKHCSGDDLRSPSSMKKAVSSNPLKLNYLHTLTL